RYQAEQRERDRKWQNFVDGLVADFDIPDRDELIEVLREAEMKYELEVLFGHGGAWSVSIADALDELIPALRKTVKLIGFLDLALAREATGPPQQRGRGGTRRRGPAQVRRAAGGCATGWPR